jgi:hypothetical protein
MRKIGKDIDFYCNFVTIKIMSNISNMRKSEALGMNFSTASSRLKLRIMLQLLKECGKNLCFRCNKEIEVAGDLSIDHKEDWLNSGRDKELFWDTKNILFSHRSCNTKAGLDKRTKFRGVTKLNKKGLTRRFQARVYENKKQKFIGYFSTPEEAKEAVNKYKSAESQ